MGSSASNCEAHALLQHPVDSARTIAADTPLTEQATSCSSCARVEPHLQRSSSVHGGEFRLRFYQYNMARNDHMRRPEDLIGQGGHGFLQDNFEMPFQDGSKVDAVFVVLTETRFKVGAMVRELREHWQTSRPQSGLNAISAKNAFREKLHAICPHCISAPLARLVAPLVAPLARMVMPLLGNVKTMLAFNSDRFVEEGGQSLAGFFTNNPEKALLGTSLVCKDEGVRFCFFGTHFPMQKMAALLKKQSVDTDTLRHAKRLYAGILRRVLSEVCHWGIANANTVIFIQGDLNSRTVIEGSEGKDVLLELLRDDAEQQWIRAGLSLPEGRWREVVAHGGIDGLPVTYKFAHTSTGSAHMLTMGDILRAESHSNVTVSTAADRELIGDASALTKTNSVSSLSGHSPPTSSYQQVLESVGAANLRAMNFNQTPSPSKFNNSHFPASTDRILYWTPDSLADRMSWKFPHGGYQVLQHQEGSDHRPVLLEAVLNIEPLNHSGEHSRTSRFQQRGDRGMFDVRSTTQ